MSRFRTIRSKGKFYVVTTDSNGLAGGPYDDADEAQARADRLAKLEEAQAQQTAAMKARDAQHPMRITPGYRSADVEDGRAAPPAPGPDVMPPWMQQQVKWNGIPRGQLPPPDWSQPPAAARHHIPIDPNDPAPDYTMDDRGWMIRLGTAGQTQAEADAKAAALAADMKPNSAPPPAGKPLGSPFPPETWGDVRVRAGVPYKRGPKR